jgi:hypothetical protein
MRASAAPSANSNPSRDDVIERISMPAAPLKHANAVRQSVVSQV